MRYRIIKWTFFLGVDLNSVLCNFELSRVWSDIQLCTYYSKSDLEIRYTSGILLRNLLAIRNPAKKSATHPESRLEIRLTSKYVLEIR